MERCNFKIILFCMAINFVLFAEDISTSTKSVDGNKRKSSVAASSKMVDFKYSQTDLKDILNDYAQLRGMNLLYVDQITSKITFDAGKKISALEAWDFLIMILDQAGFTLVYRDDNTYEVMTNKNATSENVPLYMNVDYHTLPDSREKIRYIYSCNNIQVSKQTQEITTILTNLLGTTPVMVSTKSSSGAEEKVILNDQVNSIIFTMSSEMIKAAMNIISIFDEPGIKETVEILPLKYAVSSEVATILIDMIGSNAQKQVSGFVSLTSGTSNARYFSEFATVVDLDPKLIRKLNSLVIIGRTQDVEHIKNFIQKYLDIPQQSGKSFFHVVELQWIQSVNMLTALQTLVTPTSTSGQSTGSISSTLAFDPQIKIIQETPNAATQSTSANNTPGIQGANVASPVASTNVGLRGGNRIIVASSDRDWARIESLIKQVDIPRRQVIIEALIVDLELSFIRRLASQLRTRGLTPSIFPKYMQAQAGLILNNILYTDTTSGTSYLTGDLSNILSNSTTPQTAGGFTPPGVSLSNNGQVGWNSNYGTNPNDSGSVSQVGSQSAQSALSSSTVFMISNSNPAQTNGVWAFFQLLSTHKSAKILTRPVIIASNNQPSSISSGVLKNLAGGVTGSNSPTISYSYMPANISIGFTPIISSNNVVNLQLNINLVSWQNPANETDGTQIQRVLNTNVSAKSGDIIVLGGLIQEVVARSKVSIPFVDNIPIISSFTSNRYKNTTRNQLFILLRATVVTKHASNYVIQQFEDYEDAFSSLKDPITRWFFNEDSDRGSEKVNDKIQDLTDTGRPSAEKEQLSQIEGFLKPKYDSNPLGVSWFSDLTKDKKIEELTSQLKDISNPFEIHKNVSGVNA